MNTPASQKLDNISGYPVTSSESGSKNWACDQLTENRPNPPLTTNSLLSGPAEGSELTSTSGTGQKPSHCSTATNEKSDRYIVRQSGNIGQEIVNADGIVIAWATDFLMAQVIARLLNNYETNQK